MRNSTHKKMCSLKNPGENPGNEYNSMDLVLTSIFIGFNILSNTLQVISVWCLLVIMDFITTVSLTGISHHRHIDMITLS